MNDTTRRFLDAVLERVPESRIVEVRLFPPIRQGGVESGIAVLAVHPEPPLTLPGSSALDPVDMSDPLFDDGGDTGARGGETPVGLIAFDDDTQDDESAADDLAPLRAADAGRDEPEIPEAPAVHGELLAERAIQADGVAAPSPEAAAATREREPTRERAVELEAAVVDTDSDDAEDGIALGDLFALPERPVTQAGHDRLAILCARYKLIIKGPDRGRWDLEIVHQADAPLDTLDSVIKGVVRRSGDDAVPERFSRQSLRDLLDAPAWATDA
jgi:hypothetical protein